MDETAKKPIKCVVGDDLYGLSVAELEIRIGLLKQEITRVEGELANKRKDFDAAELLFSPKS